MIKGHVSQLHCFDYSPTGCAGGALGNRTGDPCLPGHMTSGRVLCFVATRKSSKEQALSYAFRYELRKMISSPETLAIIIQAAFSLRSGLVFR